MDDNNLRIGRDERLPILGANIIFLIGIMLLFAVDILVNIYVKSKNIKLSIDSFYNIALVTEFLFILLPSYLYILFTGKKVREVLRINKLSFVNILIVIGIMIFLLPVTGLINYIVASTINMIGRPIPNPILAISNLRGLLIGTAVIAGSAGICEEVMFRGVILRGYEKFGKLTALIVTSLLFAVMHRNIQSVVGIFFIGLVIGYVVYRTNSIFAGMVAHFTNNAIVVLITFGLNQLADRLGININELAQKQQEAGLTQMNTAAAIFWIIIVLFSAVVFAGLITLLRYNTRQIAREHEFSSETVNEQQSVGLVQYIPLIIGLALISVKFVQDIFYILSLNMPEWMKYL